ncbi:MAG TPA: tetraacyldisaccharide 4'-kinase [Bacteroidia bacterium]|nr:tetraacyldisaccharide 4'-kinase [Bacteroidia bacterium]
MQTLRRLLWPFSILYGVVMQVRNFLFDRGIIKSSGFPLPVIGIGNLSTGGTGKTPHVEFLIRLLQKEYKVATLSRGYGRHTKGFMLLKAPANTWTYGDEPMQYFTKFPAIRVSVGEDRTEAIEELLRLTQRPDIILMDDAYQHRYVNPGHSILLIEYDTIFKTDFLLPAGNLREPFSGKKRADTIIITKSPTILVPIERKRILEKLEPLEHQQVFFSFYKYGEFNRVSGKQSGMLMGASYYMEKRFTILMVTGIANPSGILEYLRRHTDKLETVIFPDHHEFKAKDIKKIQEAFDNIANPSKIIVTTEKDAMRLQNPELEPLIRNLPLFYLPIEVAFHQDENAFNNRILDFVKKYPASRHIQSSTR